MRLFDYIELHNFDGYCSDLIDDNPDFGWGGGPAFHKYDYQNKEKNNQHYNVEMFDIAPRVLDTFNNGDVYISKKSEYVYGLSKDGFIYKNILYV